MALRNSLWLGALLGGAAVITYSSLSGESSFKAPGRRKAAPDFVLRDGQGSELKLTDYRGKVVLVNFWATWCGPCRIEIPWFIEFEKAYRDRGFTVIGISMDDDGWRSVKPYIGEQNINYPIVLGTEDLARRLGGVDSLPTTLLVDREGRLAGRHVGLVSKGAYQEEIGRLLGD